MRARERKRQNTTRNDTRHDDEFVTNPYFEIEIFNSLLASLDVLSVSEGISRWCSRIGTSDAHRRFNRGSNSCSERLSVWKTTGSDASESTMYAEETESAAATKEWMSPATPPRRMVSVSTPPPPYMPKDMSVSGMDYCRESYDAHRRHVVESPLIYVGVTMHRQADCPSCMSLFLFERSYLVVGNIQQDLMQRITTWAWATKFPPKIGSYDFRSSFGPLYSTSLLQLVPGDVIISINGRSITSLDVDAYLSKETRLDILAVRSETARYEAHSILSRDVPNRDYHVAQAAFRSMGSLIRTISNPCQRRLFTQPPHESNGTWKYDRQHAPVKIPNVTSHKKTAAKGGHFSVTQHAVKRAFMPVQPASKVDSTVCDAEKFLFRTKEGNPHVVRNELSPLDPGDRTQLVSKYARKVVPQRSVIRHALTSLVLHLFIVFVSDRSYVIFNMVDETKGYLARDAGQAKDDS